MKPDVFIVYVTRGILAIVCGGTLLFIPSPTTATLAIVFSAYCILDGIASFVLSLGGSGDKDPRWYLVGESIINITAGILIFIFGGVFSFLMPLISGFLLSLLVAAKIVLSGLLGLLVGIFRKQAGLRFRLPIGLASIIFGLVMFYLHHTPLLTFIIPIGIYALAVGVFAILASLKLKNMSKSAGPAKT